MNGFLLLIPLLLIRYGVLSLLSKEALKRAAFFPPMLWRERIAYWIYQISTLLILACLCFLRVRMDSLWFYVALTVYGIGVLLLLVSTVHFAQPTKNGISLAGLYRFSRNPMYVAYFVYFLGCGLLTRSFLLLALLMAFQISAHWIILAEERWCLETFGKEYAEYRNRVRRYL